MRMIDDRDIDNLMAILDYCDRIISIEERFGNTFEQFNDVPLLKLEIDTKAGLR